MEAISATSQSLQKNSSIKQPGVVRFFAHLFSYIFHPLFIPLYVVYYLAFMHSPYFLGYEQKARWTILGMVFLNMVVFPGVTVFLLKGVGFIDSIFLKTQKDRVIPYIGAGIFYFWMYLVFHNQIEIPLILTSFVFGVFIASSAALIANIYLKISMHAIGVGGLIGLMLVVLYTSQAASVSIPLMIAVLITGIVCTSRLIISDHSQKEIYSGLFLGFICQLIAAAI